MSATTEYIAIYLEENTCDNDVDTRMFIIYDDDEQTFYLYGTRTPTHIEPDNSNFINYNYKYHISKLNSLVDLIYFINDKLKNNFTIGVHNVVIDNDEVNDVDFNYLNDQLNKYNEIVAYDYIKLRKFELKRIINMIVSY